MLVEFKTFFCDGWWTAHATGHAIVTQGKTVGELVDNIVEATELHFDEEIEQGEQITIITKNEPAPEVSSEAPTLQFEYKVDLNARATGC